VANDGFSGLERARAMLPDVILTDLGMPQMDGYHFAEEVRRLPGLNRVPLVAISGYGQAKDRQRSFEAGFERHLTKPINPDELRMVLDEIDERRTPVGAAE
jgi:CheY-like chemotaxis protein